MNQRKGRDLQDASLTQLRILQRKGVKIAVRLENIFWSQLDDLARDDKVTTSKLVFDVFERNKGTKNRTGLLRCYSLERVRSKVSVSSLNAASFDMLGLIAACPTPVAIITPQRKISAFNPAFSDLVGSMRGSLGKGMGIQLSFSEPLQKIQQLMIEQPRRIFVFQIGIQVGDAPVLYFFCRFALVDRSKGSQSLVVLFFEDRQNLRTA